jgi:hypothetical protein
LVSAIGLVAITVTIAAADAPTQSTTSSLDPSDAVSTTSTVEGPGYKVGESNVLHPVVGVETGVVSNVFYRDTNPISSALLRIIAEMGIGTLSAQRLTALDGDSNAEARTNPGSLEYRADVHLNYDIFLTDNKNVTAQDGLGAGVLLRGVINPQRPWSIGIQDDYNRLLRATNFESSVDTNRDVNTFRIGAQYKPVARTLSGTLFYQNTIDVFEQNNQAFANRFLNSVGLRVNWQWLPKTRIYTEVSESFVTGLGNSSTKVNAFPLTAYVGLQSLITAKTGISTRIGYTNGFYTSGPSYSAIMFGTQLGYRYSPLGGVSVGYNYQHEDSINANFYRDHSFTAALSQQLIPLQVGISANLRFRQYEGITAVMGPGTRDDTLLSISAGVGYNFRNWLAMTADYTLSAVSTDYRYVTPDGFMGNPSYVRHQLMAGVRAAF